MPVSITDEAEEFKEEPVSYLVGFDADWCGVLDEDRDVVLDEDWVENDNEPFFAKSIIF